MALTCSIVGTYYVLSGHGESMIFTTFFSCLSIDAIAFYIISCKILFQVPDVMATCKDNCYAMLQKKESRIKPWDKKIRIYSVRAIPALGLRDGL